VFSSHLLFNLEIGNRRLRVAHQIPDLDSFIGGDCNPLSLGIEHQLVDLTVSVELNSVLIHLGDIIDSHDLSSSSSSQVLSIGRNGDTVHILFEMLVTRSDLEVGVPYLDSSIPTHSAEVGFMVLQDWRVSHTAHPVLMVGIITSEFVLSSSVP
jgi:hypothetical protein